MPSLTIAVPVNMEMEEKMKDELEKAPAAIQKFFDT